MKFKRKEKDWGDEILVDISLEIQGKEIGGISYTYLKEESELERTKWDVQIENFDVKPEFQGKGYGSVLLKKILQEIDEKGLSAQLGATFGAKQGLDREGLHGFYERYGFRDPTESEEKEWLEKYGTRLTKDPQRQITMFREKGKGKGWHGEPERHSKARKTGKADFTENSTLVDWVKENVTEEENEVKRAVNLIKNYKQDPEDLEEQIEEWMDRYDVDRKTAEEDVAISKLNLIKHSSQEEKWEKIWAKVGEIFEDQNRITPKNLDFTQPQTLDLILEGIAQTLDKRQEDFIEISLSIYFCEECKGIHNIYTPIGKRHLKNVSKQYIERLNQRLEGLRLKRRSPENWNRYTPYNQLYIKSFYNEEDDLESLINQIVIAKIGNNQDFTLDAEKIGTQITEGTHLQELFEQLKKYGQIGPKIKQPFEIINTETGAVVRGFVVSELDKNIKQLTPVSSSNVRGVGQFKNELLVQFHAKGLTPQRTYRYQFATSLMAEEAYQSLTNSGSPGRWIWQNIRGHVAGTKVTKTKLGPSLSPPGQGLPTIGGTTASLVEYSISNRVPVSRVEGFDKYITQLERRTSNPTLNPQTGSRIEKLLGTRKAIRELGVSPTSVARQLRQLPKLDFTIREIDANDLSLTDDYKVKGHYSDRGKPPKRVWIRRHTRGEGTTIKDKPRMRPLKEWEKREIYQKQLAKLFGKEEYSEEFYMGNKTDYFDRKFHHKIYIADNVDYWSNKFAIARGNAALNQLPIPFQDLAYVVFYDKITDDPNSEVNEEDVPPPYKRVGWKSTYKEVDAQISYIHKTIRIRAGSWRHAHSVRHEVGHAVWWWRVSEADKQRFREIFEKKQWHLRRQGKVGKYQANDISEFFAVQFKRYYSDQFDKMFPETVSYFDRINEKFGGIKWL